MANIQIGDKIIRYHSGAATGIYTVTRKTKMQLICVAYDGANEVRLIDKGSYLKQVGAGTWSSVSYKHATPEMLAQHHAAEKRVLLLAKMASTNWSKYTTESLENIVKILNL